MSEQKTRYESAGGGQVFSEPQRAIREIGNHFAIVPETLVYSGNLPAIAVYAVLDRTSKKGDGYASLTQIAQRAHLSIARVRRARDWLCAEGFIKITKMGDGRMATDYSLPFQTRDARDTISDTPGVSQETHLPEYYSRDLNESPKREDMSPTTWPDWYATLYAIPGFKVPLVHAQTWLTAKGITVNHAETTAYSLKSQWPGRKSTPGKPQYRDAWATFQTWAKRPAFSNNGRGPDFDNSIEKYVKLKADMETRRKAHEEEDAKVG